MQPLLGSQYSFSLDKSRSWKLKEQLIAWALYVVSYSITLQTAVPCKKTPKILSQCKRKINFQRGINCVVCPHPCPLVLPLEVFRTGLSLCNRTLCSWLEEHRRRTWWPIISILPQMETQGHWLLSLCLRNLTGQIFQIFNLSPFGAWRGWKGLSLPSLLYCVCSQEISIPNWFCEKYFQQEKMWWYNFYEISLMRPSLQPQNNSSVNED